VNQSGRPAVEPLISSRELAVWLGVSHHTVRKWCSRGPALNLVPRMIPVNSVIRFCPEDVRSWLDGKAAG
jgi:hypothetical protein